MKRTKLIVKTQSKSYPIYFGSNILKTTGILIKRNLPEVKKICVISDNKLPKATTTKLVKSLKNYKIKIYKFTASENIKNINFASKIVEQLFDRTIYRIDKLIN